MAVPKMRLLRTSKENIIALSVLFATEEQQYVVVLNCLFRENK